MVPLAVGAAAVLGASFTESYGVWYNLCARSTIGNAAYEAGRAATAVRYGSTLQDVAMRTVQELASDEHEIEAVVDERCAGRGGTRREYRVRWRGYDPSWEAWRICGDVGTPIETWEPESGVEHTDALKEWRARSVSQPVQGGVPADVEMLSTELIDEALAMLGADALVDCMSQECSQEL